MKKMLTKTRPAAALLAIALLVTGLPARAQDSYGPTRHGDDLWDIAARVYRYRVVTRDQAILALLKANPQAFDAPCNASSPLKLGATLTVPPVAEAKALSPAEASAEYARQVEEWKSHQHSGSPLVCPPVRTAVPAAATTSQQIEKPAATAASQPTEPQAEATPIPEPTPPRQAPPAIPPAEAPGTAPSTQPEQAQTSVLTTGKPPALITARPPTEEQLPGQGRLEHEHSTRSPLVWIAIALVWIAIAVVLAVVVGALLWKPRRKPAPAPVSGTRPAEAVEDFAQPSADRPQTGNLLPIHGIDSQSAERLSTEEVLQQLQSSGQGLTAAEARSRLGQFGRNALEEKRVSPLQRFLGYFWGPIPWMIEVAGVLSAIIGHWDDFTIILVLLLFNALIGFWEEHKAANALDALKSQLALKARALRATGAGTRSTPQSWCPATSCACAWATSSPPTSSSWTATT